MTLGYVDLRIKLGQARQESHCTSAVSVAHLRHGVGLEPEHTEYRARDAGAGLLLLYLARVGLQPYRTPRPLELPIVRGTTNEHWNRFILCGQRDRVGSDRGPGPMKS